MRTASRSSRWCSRGSLCMKGRKGQRSFGDAERLHAALQGDVAALCKAEFQKRRVRAVARGLSGRGLEDDAGARGRALTSV